MGLAGEGGLNEKLGAAATGSGNFDGPAGSAVLGGPKKLGIDTGLGSAVVDGGVGLNENEGTAGCGDDTAGVGASDGEGDGDGSGVGANVTTFLPNKLFGSVSGCLGDSADFVAVVALIVGCGGREVGAGGFPKEKLNAELFATGLGATGAATGCCAG